jgi:hypothetical protein
MHLITSYAFPSDFSQVVRNLLAAGYRLSSDLRKAKREIEDLKTAVSMRIRSFISRSNRAPTIFIFACAVQSFIYFL